MGIAPTTNCTSSILTPVTGGVENGAGLCRPSVAAAPRLVKARSLLSAEDIERVERLARTSGGSNGSAAAASQLLVFSRGAEKHVAALDGSVPSDAVAERLADGQVHVLAKVVGG